MHTHTPIKQYVESLHNLKIGDSVVKEMTNVPACVYARVHVCVRPCMCTNTLHNT